jgi:hypothetical protein
MTGCAESSPVAADATGVCVVGVVGEGALLGEGSACTTLETFTTLLSASEKSDSSSTNTTDDVTEGGSDGAVGAGSGSPESFACCHVSSTMVEKLRDDVLAVGAALAADLKEQYKDAQSTLTLPTDAAPGSLQRMQSVTFSATGHTAACSRCRAEGSA